ncbi:SpoIID/LytB domain-containing protein [Lachnoclostridium phytofermentans]|uniref:SpoIID/LytB domain protein n=1 Tax=Lachnoclostridium phytofermentans (strain ATCC 700394 / DSM 18823 / ISDg) TaxID=357809 RepID=A9KK70_LACP7|nr:SpoIID/LytB domain-containing protein [Lachnoclostridium phytofermentans]ABX42642.1 SpoIID/LytB domain protein [Lachnoclostridium phytofermentans ISDg]
MTIEKYRRRSLLHIKLSYIGFFLIIFISILPSGQVSAQNLLNNQVLSTVPLVTNKKDMTDIRVGLHEKYEGNSSIKIQTTEIALGYCIKDKYLSEVSFQSRNGFIFQPAKGNYYVLSKSFSTYEEAKQVADKIAMLGVPTVPTAIYRNHYRVYVGGDMSSSSFSEMYQKIKGKLGYTYLGPVKNNKHRVLMSGDGVQLLIDGGIENAYPQIKAISKNSKNVSLIDLGERSYRGRLEIGCYGKTSLTAVNIINIESYLLGVVPCEMVSSWPIESLKTQAVCARSYALTKTDYTADSNAKKAYSIEDTQTNQVYRGYGYETKQATAAVAATQGEVVKYQGKMITSYYSSTSGGRTEASEDVWGSKLPYLRSVVDTYEKIPEKGPWIKEFTKSDIQTILERNDKSVGNIKKVSPSILTASSRVYSLKVTGTQGSTLISTNSLRSMFSLPSTKFKIINYQDQPDVVTVKGSQSSKTISLKNSYVISANSQVSSLNNVKEQYIVKSADNLTNFLKNAPNNSNTYYFAGMGFGHGVGMSQSGARGMASEGFRYTEIIAFYYNGCVVGQY